MKKSLIYIFCCASMLLASCSTTTELYSWYNYENSAYQYQKKNTDKTYEEAMNQYKKIIEKQKGARYQVPPGLCAEYGWMLYKSGKVKEGIDYLKKEITLYPESEVYISRILKQLEE